MKENTNVFPTKLAVGSFGFLLLILGLIHVTLFRASNYLESFSSKDIPTLQFSSAATRVVNELEFLLADPVRNRSQIVIREHVLSDSLEELVRLSSDVPEAQKMLADSKAYANFRAYREGKLNLTDHPEIFTALKNVLLDMVETYVTLKNKKLADQRFFVILSAVVSLVGAVFFFLLIYVMYRRYQLNLRELRIVSENLEKERLVSIQSAKLASLGEMGAGLAHEINNPLAVIIGKGEILLESLRMGTTNDTEIMKAVGKINEMAVRISKIVQSMKKISRGNVGEELSSVNLMNVIDDVLILISQKLRNSNVQLDLSGVSSAVTVRGNFSHLSQVLINLLNNAADELSHSGLEHKAIYLTTQTENGSAFLRVKDSGPGIPDHVRGKLFQPFFTTKEVGKGTGLGLSISKGLMKDMEGDLFLDPELKETCFVMKMKL